MAADAALDARRERGLALAKAKRAKFKHIADSKYLVPSAQDGAGGYVVDVDAEVCTCPDHETRNIKCKHLWAVTFFREERQMPDGSTVVTQTVQAVRLTYPQNWPAYNRAQSEEKERFQILLSALCAGIAEPPHARGRRPLPLRDTVFAAAEKVYGTMSGRRSTTDIVRAATDGRIGRAPSYNTVFRLVERADVTPLLTSLVGESAKPLARIETETQYAVDSTGFATTTYDRWFDHKYGKPEPRQRKRFVKLHALVGTHTHIVTNVRVTGMEGADSPEFIPLLRLAAANGVPIQEVSADKAYLSHDNIAAVEAMGARPFIPLKANSLGVGSPGMERLAHAIAANEEDFLAHYHRRSNVETVFHAIKAKFGPDVRSKLHAAQVNEVLLKCLCHNITCLVHAIHELGIEPKFWMPRTRIAVPQ